ncbi:MAG TPA: twin-arginine translocase subunit TatC [Terriglobales bacterium]|nr:twin-arginine translocase subunit TatC [Terriglobales bacterium]
MPETTLEPPPASAATEDLAGMSFLQHLEELRRRIIYSLLAIAAGFIGAWSFAPRIFALMEQPIMQALRNHRLDEKLVYLSPTEPFNIYLKVGLIAGVFIASPIVLYQVWMFISPGLYRNEKRYVLPFMFFTVVLFLAGGYFGYRVAYPAALDFLVGYGRQFQPMITIREYTNLFLTVILGLGIIFEMPVIVFFLALMGVVRPGWMWKNLRYAVLAIFVVAAVITPTSDVLNMCIFAAPMLALYLLSIAVAWLVYPRRGKAGAKAEA